MNVLLQKLKEVLFAVIPVTVIVLVLNFTLTPLDPHLLVRFLLGAFLIVIGLTIFLFGVEIGVTPIGNLMGNTIAKSNNVWIVGLAGLFLGFFISIAEPDLHILAGQVQAVTAGVLSQASIVVVVSVGIAVLLSLGLFRIVYNLPLNKMLTLIYLLILTLGIFSSSEFIAISFDASGATTGALTVPFMLALAYGVSSLKKNGTASEEDSFGLVGVASAGAILAVIVMSLFSQNNELSGSLELHITQSPSIFAPFLHELPVVAGDIILALLPLLLTFLLFQTLSFRLSRRAFKKIMKGLLYTFIGLVLFLTGVNAGFMDVGSLVGYRLALLEQPWIVFLVGFILGLVVILAEPAVYVLTTQIENVTSGYVKRRIVLFALSLGVGCAVTFSMVRIIIPGVQLWHFLLPGYLISLALSYVVPSLFVGIAFDAGGVASGPMTATFVLAFAQGVAEATEGANVLIDGFGIIAMVALTPLIALQVLGFIYKIKSQKAGVHHE
ncbi:DUF1538 domain-containing protein [Capillibacterium thermochitinicola]|uniref:DUF1538 domain-containing protein n=1 Tax=Capillibacterium thermochitinicola TaxID=2699427 RepID=A0A8J6HZ44_9FIRM|nr:DUF1538 domain-containing protein [Capillibacterium thermochitinicola]MBA2132715.1 DUF1538 domain-containing protein [Capillibacterium thermochitinicola]